MKTVLLSMLSAAAIGPLVLAHVEPDSMWARDFSFSMVGGTGGVLLCLCLYDVADIKQMARDAVGHLLTAICFGPATSFWIAKTTSMPINPQMLITVSALLGFCGASLIRTARPIWLKAWESWNSRTAHSVEDCEHP